MGEWIIPEDGIIDDLAVQIAASGQRRVRLTKLERRMAAALIVARGGTAWDVCKRLFINYSTATALVTSLTADTAGLGEVA